MAQFVIQGGQSLSGHIPVYGSKNAALPLLAATLLTPEPVKLNNIPAIRDVAQMVRIIAQLGVTVSGLETDISDVSAGVSSLTVTATDVLPESLPHEAVSQLRGSILLLGALLGRHGAVTLPLPGGDIIGARPIDVHLDAFRQLGADIQQDGGIVTIMGHDMHPGEVTLREFSVTATENVMLCAATLPGTTTIHIAATEPHIVAVGQLLQAMGAEVAGLGTHTITITGTKNLHGAVFDNIPDMLEAGFFILLAAATRSDVTVTNVPISQLPLFFKKLADIGISLDLDTDDSSVTVQTSELKPFKVQTMPQPGIPTDLQAPFAVVATQAGGTSLIHDPMYESRFRHCDELIKMGAAITVCDPHRVVIEGPTQLHGQHIKSLDIRSGATLLMAGLLAKGETIIDEAEIIDRGYAQLMERLQAIGAQIERRGETAPLVAPVSLSAQNYPT